jgi:copper resistance protein D
MAGFVDVLLRGAILVLTSLVLGGVVWTRFILRSEPHAKPTPSTALAMRVVAAASLVAAGAQAATLLVALGEVAGAERWPLGTFAGTTFARAALGRIGLAVAAGFMALRLARRPAGPAAWRLLNALALALTVTSAVLSHAVARVDSRAALLALDAVHQAAAAIWIGGLAHLTVWASRRGGAAAAPPPAALRSRG